MDSYRRVPAWKVDTSTNHHIFIIWKTISQILYSSVYSNRRKWNDVTIWEYMNKKEMEPYPIQLYLCTLAHSWLCVKVHKYNCSVLFL